MPVAVLKLGGSLLTLPDLPRRLSDLFAVRRDEQPLLVCGGGRAAETVQEWDSVHRLGDEQAHWLALRSIQLNEQLLLALCPNELSLARTRDEAAAVWQAGRVPLLSLFEFVRDEERNSDTIDKLPHTWDVTSDSLAVWMAIRWPAHRLLLLKSTDLPSESDRLDLAEAALRGLVDGYFPNVGHRLPDIGWINLRRAGELVIQRFRPATSPPLTRSVSEG